MAETAINTTQGSIWSGGQLPLGSSYGKLMMWMFLLTDVFTFSALLVTYGYFRMESATWPDPDLVFQSVPFIIEHGAPLVFVGLMTFILILSSVTMVLAVEAGHRGEQKEVGKYLLGTAILGATFLGCQALEWEHLLHLGIHHELGGMTISHPMSYKLESGEMFNGPLIFGQLFFIITGFHGFHVFSGVLLVLMAYFMNKKGVFAKRGHYEMVEKIGLYWHFVDLVWVFVFTLFYLL